MSWAESRTPERTANRNKPTHHPAEVPSANRNLGLRDGFRQCLHRNHAPLGRQNGLGHLTSVLRHQDGVKHRAGLAKLQNGVLVSHEQRFVALGFCGFKPVHQPGDLHLRTPQHLRYLCRIREYSTRAVILFRNRPDVGPAGVVLNNLELRVVTPHSGARHDNFSNVHIHMVVVEPKILAETGEHCGNGPASLLRKILRLSCQPPPNDCLHSQ
mmetsp:Transcript_45709/g.99228  ORF Transcript_45709/g.99228 Transcript_45709/m.99228 type:complete len:213 (-) Transcript_45709:1198-1836(-)